MHASVALPALQLKTKTTGTESRLETFRQPTNLSNSSRSWGGASLDSNGRRHYHPKGWMMVALHPLNYGDLGKDL